jgi:hypothetical protein
MGSPSPNFAAGNLKFLLSGRYTQKPCGSVMSVMAIFRQLTKSACVCRGLRTPSHIATTASQILSDEAGSEVNVDLNQRRITNRFEAVNLRHGHGFWCSAKPQHLTKF